MRRAHDGGYHGDADIWALPTDPDDAGLSEASGDVAAQGVGSPHPTDKPNGRRIGAPEAGFTGDETWSTINAWKDALVAARTPDRRGSCVTVSRTSIAFDGVGGQWRWYEEDGRKLAIDEIKDCATALGRLDGSLAQRDFLGLVHAKLIRAQQGRLLVPGDGRPHLHRAAGVMEIKWGVDVQQWRLYYCEPLRLSAERVMLGLLFARKQNLDQQDEHIGEAARRWTVWQSAEQA